MLYFATFLEAAASALIMALVVALCGVWCGKRVGNSHVPDGQMAQRPETMGSLLDHRVFGDHPCRVPVALLTAVIPAIIRVR